VYKAIFISYGPPFLDDVNVCIYNNKNMKNIVVVGSFGSVMFLPYSQVFDYVNSVV
jgi:hypothetical protein